MDVRTRYILIALGAVAVIVVVATLLLPRKLRLALYLVLILVTAGAAGYVTLARNSLPSDYVLEPYASGMSLPTFAKLPRVAGSEPQAASQPALAEGPDMTRSCHLIDQPEPDFQFNQTVSW